LHYSYNFSNRYVIKLKYLKLYLYLKMIMSIVLIAVLILVVASSSWISCVKNPRTIPVEISEHFKGSDLIFKADS